MWHKTGCVVVLAIKVDQQRKGKKDPIQPAGPNSSFAEGCTQEGILAF